MKVKKLKKILEVLDDETEIVLANPSCAWKCFQPLKEVQEKELSRDGNCYQEEILSDEPVFLTKLVILK